MSERRKWSIKEDSQLQKFIEKFGTDWRVISAHLQYRTPKQCRERWINHSGPGIIKGKLTEDEWNIVVASQESLGNRWSEIAKLIPGRTPNQIKNLWHAMERRRKSIINPREDKRKNQVILTETYTFSNEDDSSLTHSPIPSQWQTKRPKLDPRHQILDEIHYKQMDEMENESHREYESELTVSPYFQTDDNKIDGPPEKSSLITPLDALVLTALEFYENDHRSK